MMDKIEIDQNMKNRVLSNVKNTELDNVSVVHLEKKKINISQIALMAACFSIVFIGGFSVGQNIHIPIKDTALPFISIDDVENEVIEIEDKKEFKQILGFDMISLDYMPFEPIIENYIAYWGNMGEISYIGENETDRLIVRKSKGFVDNSGDYSNYTNVDEVEIGNLVYTLKGNSKNDIYLILWHDKHFSYSVTFFKGQDKKDVMKIINSLK